VRKGALRPLDERTAELRRMFVLPAHRSRGVARSILVELERRALAFGYCVLRLETGFRRQAALRLCAVTGFRRIDPFVPYNDDPRSICFEKEIAG
jgi:putative acetyltransferase